MLTLIAEKAEFGTSFLPSTGYGADISSASSACQSLETIISNIIGFITVLAGIIFITYFIWGTIDWITSGGDSGKVANARNKMVQGVIGLILVVASYGIIGLVGTITGLSVLDLCEQVENITPNGDRSDEDLRLNDFHAIEEN